MLDRVDTRLELADSDLDALEATVDAAADVADLVEDRGLGRPDSATNLIAQLVDTA